MVFVEVPTRRAAAKKTSATKDAPAAVTNKVIAKKATMKKAKIPRAENAQDTTSVPKASRNIRDEAAILEPGENDMRRRLRPRKRS